MAQVFAQAIDADRCEVDCMRVSALSHQFRVLRERGAADPPDVLGEPCRRLEEAHHA